MNESQIKASLETVDGFKKYFRGLFAGGRAKKAFELYQSADKKDVLKAYVVREDEYDDSVYAVFAFSTKGSIDAKTLENMKATAAEFDLGSIRYESASWGGFWKLPWNEYAPHDVTDAIEGGDKDIYARIKMSVSGKAAKVDVRYVVYIEKDGVGQILAITANHLA